MEQSCSGARGHCGSSSAEHKCGMRRRPVCRFLGQAGFDSTTWRLCGPCEEFGLLRSGLVPLVVRTLQPSRGLNSFLRIKALRSGRRVHAPCHKGPNFRPGSFRAILHEHLHKAADRQVGLGALRRDRRSVCGRDRSYTRSFQRKTMEMAGTGQESHPWTPEPRATRPNTLLATRPGQMLEKATRGDEKKRNRLASA